jgi:hypothetical protein
LKTFYKTMGAGICAPAKLQQGEENRGEKPPFAYQTAPTLPAKQIVQTTTTTPLNPNSNSTFISKKTPTTENGNDDTTNLKTSIVAFDTTAPKSENQTLQKGQVTTTTTTPHPPPITPPPSPSPSTATTTANATNDAITSSTIVAGENDTKKLTRTPTTLTTNDNNATRKKSPKTDNAIDNNNDNNESNNVRSPAESPGRWDDWDEVDDDPQQGSTSSDATTASSSSTIPQSTAEASVTTDKIDGVMSQVGISLSSNVSSDEAILFGPSTNMISPQLLCTKCDHDVYCSK